VAVNGQPAKLGADAHRATLIAQDAGDGIEIAIH
jgi:hypothetical protein